MEPENFWFQHQKLLSSFLNGWEGSRILRLTLRLKIFYPQNPWVSSFLYIKVIGTDLITSKMCFHAQIAWMPVSVSDLGCIINDNTLLLIKRQYCSFFKTIFFFFLPFILLPSPPEVGRTGILISFYRWVKTRSEVLSPVA